MYAIVEIDRDGNKSYATNSPLGKEEAQKQIAQLRKWAKDDGSKNSYKLKKVYLSM